jgi:hypothetical protein
MAAVCALDLLARLTRIYAGAERGRAQLTAVRLRSPRES